MTTAPSRRATITAATEPNAPISELVVSWNRVRIVGGAPSHEESELAARHLAARELACNPALVQHDDAVAQVQNLVEIEGDQQDGLAGITYRDQFLVDEFDGADIEPACGLDGQQHIGVPLQLAR